MARIFKAVLPSELDRDLPEPLFELHGWLSRFDLSAWISTAALALGISRVGPSVIAADFQSGGYGVYIIVLAYLAFIAAVLCIQRHMQIELSAQSFGKASALVTGGVFKLSRNPIYLAFFMPLASLAYFSTYTAAASIIVYVTAMNLTVIRTEERDLQQSFGNAFRDYCTAVPRWFV